MAASMRYIDTFIMVFEASKEKCDGLCQTFFDCNMQQCVQLYEQDKETLQFPRKKQKCSPSQRSILLAAGQIAQISHHFDTIEVFLTEIEKIDIEDIKQSIIATPDSLKWQDIYHSNQSQFKCDNLKKLWDAVVITRLLASGWEGIGGIAIKIRLSAQDIQNINLSLQGLTLSLHPNSPRYYANNITLFHKFTALFFKMEPWTTASPPNDNNNQPSPAHSAGSSSSQPSPANSAGSSDSQISSVSPANSFSTRADFFSYLARTISDISLPSADDLSDEEDAVTRGVVKRPLTPAIPRKG